MVAVAGTEGWVVMVAREPSPSSSNVFFFFFGGAGGEIFGVLGSGRRTIKQTAHHVLDFPRYGTRTST